MPLSPSPDEFILPPRLVARLVVALDDIVTHIWPGSQKVHESLMERFQNQAQKYPTSDLPSDLTGWQPAVLANLLPMARHGLDGQIDSYYVTAKSVHRNRLEGKPIEVVELVTVQMPSGLLASILARFKEIVERVAVLNAPLDA